MQNIIPTLQQIQEAHRQITPFIHHTPILTSKSLNQLVGADIYFKCENFQKIGAFKIRGATHAILSLPEDATKYGVATHSSGNHAQAVALTAKNQGLKAYIVMPDNSPKVKIAAVKGYGAEIIPCKASLASREETLNQVIAKTQATMIHPYNDYYIIAGQATTAKELLEEVGSLEVIMTPVGGGGLMSGTALATHYLSPKTRIIGAEPSEADDAFRSLQSGILQSNTSTNTIADGLRSSLGEKTFGIIQKYVHKIIPVEDEDIMEAMRMIWERMKIVIEPSAAVTFAALLKNKEDFQGKKIGIILTGGNIDLENLPF